MPRVATDKQKEASRLNGSKSSGPKTAAGKAQSSMNAFKHGRYALLTCVMRIENPEAFDAYKHSLYTTYQPANDAEIFLVDAIAAADWRIERCTAIETRALDIEVAHHIHGVGLDPKLPMPLDGQVLACASLCKRSNLLQYLASQQSRFVAQRASLQRQLFALQDRRPANQPPFRRIPDRPYDPAFFNRPENQAEVVEMKPPEPPPAVSNEPEKPAPERLAPQPETLVSPPGAPRFTGSRLPDPPQLR